MGLAIGDTAPHRRPGPGRVFGVHDIEVERQVDAGGAVPRGVERFVEDVAHAALIEVAHGEDAGAALLEDLALAGIEVAHPDEHRVARQDLGRAPAHIDEVGIAEPQADRERHAVDVARGRGVRRVRVAVGVEPDEPDRIPLAREVTARAGDRADREAVIAAQDQGQPALLERLLDPLAQLGAGGEDRGLVAELVLPHLLGLGDHDVEVARVGDPVAESFEPRLEVGDPDRRGAHVDAAPARSEVHRDADNLDVALGLSHEPRSLTVGPDPAKPATAPVIPRRSGRGAAATPAELPRGLRRSRPPPPPLAARMPSGARTELAAPQRLAGPAHGRAGRERCGPRIAVPPAALALHPSRAVFTS